MKPFYIATTRFSNSTWQENVQWKKRHNWKGCIYGVPSPLPTYIPQNATIYIIEMNNDTNKIIGIGAIRNKPRFQLTANIYTEQFYNRYIYRDKSRISREELYAYSPFYRNFIRHIENILFKGKSHMKRGQGFTSIKINWTQKNNKPISLPITPRIFGYYFRKYHKLPVKKFLTQLEQIQHYILYGFKHLPFRHRRTQQLK
tara:strand:+ start:1214 stop:1816 length:603 start_codon:yes stop_codon:yes gene_type:complete